MGVNLRIRSIRGKEGFRVIVIAESFNFREYNKSILAGAVFRGAYIIEDFYYTFSTLYGLDATNAVLRIVNKLKRPDIHVILLSGVIISLYNVIDIRKVFEETKLPIIAISYRESEGIEDILKKLPYGDKRLEILKRNGDRIKIRLKNNYYIFVRPIGLSIIEAKNILNKVTIFGKIPEPIKIVKKLARGIFRALIDNGLVEKIGQTRNI